MSWRLLFELPASPPGAGQDEAMQRVAQVVEGLLQPPQSDRVRRSIAEALQGTAHGDAGDGPNVGALVRVWIWGPPAAQAPSGRRGGNGWGYFLLERQEDGAQDGPHRVVELYLYQEAERTG
ncbi:MAG: hypothetical protein RBU35_11940 [Anaerolineae bacterium]|nr:hypothetical protein [Anaerolineae bacterium]